MDGKEETKEERKARKALKKQQKLEEDVEAVEEVAEVVKETKEERKARKALKKEQQVEEVAPVEPTSKRVKQESLNVDDVAEYKTDLVTFEKAKTAFPKVSWEMFDGVTQGFSAPTPIQAQTWGATLSGRDVIGIAATGSGKTLAFVLPIVARLMETSAGKSGQVRALALGPTRELVMQSEEVAQKACKFAKNLKCAIAYGGVARSTQQGALRKGADFLCATPGRLMDFMESGDVDLSQCSFVVLDEADRMLDMGFERDVRKILAASTNPTRQTLMFSATWPEEIRSIASEFLSKTAVKIALSGNTLKANTSVTQNVEVMDASNKEKRLFELLSKYKKDRVIVFALYKKEAERLEQTLQRKGFKVAGVHGDKSQAQRESAVAQFAKGEALVLVATDVASRGLDIKGVNVVINNTFPLTVEDYVHRIGRTGRAGATGESYTFFTEHDKLRAGELQNVLREAGVEVPPELLKFGGTVRKKEHALWGAHFKADPELANKSATLTSFADSDDE
ncbi:hypothetical protein BASA81_002454 [Batrachochytrium salamandrivorans]|nr:hypothetical protein BASA81_002454 [Batrachochytrium salamandrivorans]